MSVADVAVVGGGWAGCAAAVELAAGGCKVTLIEAARTLGGRARSVEVNGKLLDNGQHIMLGAYSETLRLLRQAGIKPADALLHLPLQMRYPPGSGMDFVAPRLPAPLHLIVALLRAKGLDRDDKMALARFSTSARWMDWTLYNDCSVSELLERFDQTARLVALMWRPLCLAALNTPPERASAQVFLNVLRDSLGARRAASDMLVPRLGLGALFPAAAAAFIEARGGVVRTGVRAESLQRSGSGWQLNSGQFDAVVLATPPSTAAALLEGLGAHPLPTFDYEPITTCYLQYDAGVRLDLPFYALEDHPDAGEWGQFLFDRGQLDDGQAGLMAVVISASGGAAELGQDALSTAVARQLARVLGRPEFASPSWSKVITEKRATFACTPGLVRPGNETGLPGVLLAGDYTASAYPATLESAIRSGAAAARAILRGPAIA
ncbi:MAG TPA: hydroxysqualene dehydroxylase HpnE [Telluria sp.]